MTPDDMNHVTGELVRLWPNKYHDNELYDFVKRLDGYPVGDVLRAFDEHKNTKKFPPAVSEIRAILQGKEMVDVKFPTLPESLRSANKWLANTSDRETLLRFYRQEWHLYDARARDRQVKALAAVEQDPKVRANHEAAKVQWEAQWRGALAGVKTRLLYGLMELPDADRGECQGLAELIDASPDVFRVALWELKSGALEDVLA